MTEAESERGREIVKVRTGEGETKKQTERERVREG